MGLKTSPRSWSKVTVRNAAAKKAALNLAPQGPEIPPAALAPLPPDNTADGLLKASEKDSDLLLIITPEASAISGETFHLILDGTELAYEHIFDESTDLPTFTMPLPAAGRTQGVHQVGYRHRLFSHADIFSELTPFIVDVTYAGSPETPPSLGDFDQRVLDDGLSLDLLTELGDKVTATLGAYGGSDPYSGPMPGDVIIPYIGDIAGDPVILTGTVTPQQNITVTFTKDHITQVADDGRHDFYYTITDRAGNLSPNSFVQPITILVKSSIPDLLAPVIEAAGSTSGDIILEAEARAGVQVTIPAHASLIEGDEVYIVWGGSDQPPARVPGPNIEFDVTVEWLTLAAKGSGDFNVSYYVQRNGGRVGHSPDTPVKVNIDIPGGPDTTPGTPENENLSPLNVVGDADGELNVITVDDSLVGATATVPWFFSDGTTGYLKESDVITLIWDGSELSPGREITTTDVIAEDDIIIDIPSATLLLASGNLDVSYKVTRKVTDAPDFNSSYSLKQVVDVKSANGAPGGISPLGPSTLPEEGIFFNDPMGAWIINHLVVAGGTPIEIPHYLNKKAGDLINITFTAKGEIDGSGPEFPDAAWSVVDHVVTAGDEENGASVFILPEANMREVIPYGRGVITYTVKNDIATKDGETIEVVIDNRGSEA